MSPHRTQANNAALVAALVIVAVVFVVTIVGALLAFLFAPTGQDASTVIGPLLGTLAPTIAAIALLVQVKDVKNAQAETDAKVDKVAQDTHALTNGLLDSKVRAAFGDVAHPDVIRPDAHEQIARDRAARDAAHEAAPDTAPEA